jgi:hypothetical protein
VACGEKDPQTGTLSTMDISFDKDSLLDRAFRVAQVAYKGAGALEKLPTPLRTVLMIFAAQGIIDNGGLQYFFENDFPGQPPYSTFVDAYREIGAKDEAALAAGVDLFPFPDPHQHLKLRREFQERFPDEGPFAPYSDFLCGDKKVWEMLLEYVLKHADAFAT